MDETGDDCTCLYKHIDILSACPAGKYRQGHEPVFASPARPLPASGLKVPIPVLLTRHPGNKSARITHSTILAIEKKRELIAGALTR